MSRRMESDVVVVGAGPAGCSAATALARGGLHVVMVDRARFPRDKCCGDGLTAGALRRLEELGLRPAAVASFTPVRSLAVRSPRGMVADLPLSPAGACHAAVARRLDLDAALVELSRDAGVEVVEGHGLERLDVDESAARGCASYFDGDLELRSRLVVAADGAWSRVRGLVGAGTQRARRDRVLPGGLHGFRAYATGVDGPGGDRMWVWFTPRLLPGYAWSFPIGDGTANVGICMQRRTGVAGRELAAAWREELTGPFLRSVLGPGATFERAARSWPIPAGIDPVETSAKNGRVLYVGDAASAADPFTGEGIAQALETGAAAAGAIVAAGAGAPDRAAARYGAEVRGRLAVEHRLGRALAALASHPAGIESIVQVAGHSSWTRANAGRWLFEMVPRSLPLTPSRWRPGALHLPPPYRGWPASGV